MRHPAWLLALVAACASPPPDASIGATAPWVRQFGGPGTDIANGIAMGEGDTVYVVGVTDGVLPDQFGFGGRDAFVRAYDADGVERWTHQFGTTGDDVATAVATASNGDVYVVGSTTGPATDGLGLASTDVFVRRYASDGELVWARAFGTTEEDGATAVAADAEAGVYVVGMTRGVFEGERSAGSSDAFVRRYRSDGSVDWTRQFGTDTDDDAHGVSVDARGGVYVVGGVLVPGHCPGDCDAFLRAYDATGVVLWTRQVGTPDFDRAEGVATDATGRIYLVGSTNGAFPGFENGGGTLPDVFVTCWTADGEIVWTRQFGGPLSDFPGGIAVVGDGTTYVAGTTYGTIPPAHSAGEMDVFIAVLEATGARRSITQPGTRGWDEGASIAARRSRVCVAGKTFFASFPGQTNGGIFDAFVMCIPTDAVSSYAGPDAGEPSDAGFPHDAGLL